MPSRIVSTSSDRNGRSSVFVSTVTTLVRVVFSRYLGRFSKERSSATKEKRTVLIPTIGESMQYLTEIKGLDNLPDAQIVERKVIDGQRGALVFIFGRLARNLGYPDGLIVVRWLPMDYVDTFETTLEAEGFSVSRA